MFIRGIYNFSHICTHPSSPNMISKNFPRCYEPMCYSISHLILLTYSCPYFHKCIYWKKDWIRILFSPLYRVFKGLTFDIVQSDFQEYYSIIRPLLKIKKIHNVLEKYIKNSWLWIATDQLQYQSYQESQRLIKHFVESTSNSFSARFPYHVFNFYIANTLDNLVLFNQCLFSYGDICNCSSYPLVFSMLNSSRNTETLIY